MQILLDKNPVEVDFSAEHTPASLRNYQPDIYFDGKRYCFLLGDSEDGVFGYGETIAQAMIEWDKAYQKRKMYQ